MPVKIPITPGSVDPAALMTSLQEQFPEYKIKKRAKNMLLVEKSGWVGTNVMIRKGKVHVIGAFSNMGYQILFVLLILLALLPGLLVFLIAINPKHKKMEKEVGEGVKRILAGDTGTPATPPPAPQPAAEA